MRRTAQFLLSTLTLLMLSCGNSKDRLASQTLELEKQNPLVFFDAASKKYEEGKKADAAFLFYLGQLRIKYYLQVTNAGPQDREAYSAIQAVLGEAINGYLGHDIPAWIAIIDKVIDWDAHHDNQFCPKSKDPHAQKEILDGLKRLRAKIANAQAHGKDLSYIAYSRAYDFSLFDTSYVKKLADAVEYEDTNAIIGFSHRNDGDIDYPEPKFGNTLLMLAVANKRTASVKALLEAGANPNKFDKTHDTNPMIIACDRYGHDCDTAILGLLLRYGGDPNTLQYIRRDTGEGDHGYINETVLMLACQADCLPRVKMLVNAGADINKCTYHPGYGAITAAASADRLENLRYLLVEKNAKVPEYCINDTLNGNIVKRTLTDLLQADDYRKTPERQKIKQEILQYLAAKGMQ